MRNDRDRIRFTITDFQALIHFLSIAEMDYEHIPDRVEEIERLKKKIEQAMIKLKKRRAV